MSSRALDTIARLLAEDRDADDVLRGAVEALAIEPDASWAAIAFLEGGELVVGPSAGAPDELRRQRVPVSFHGERVGELWVDGDVDERLLEQAAELVSAHVLIGWDTGGERWEP